MLGTWLRLKLDIVKHKASAFAATSDAAGRARTCDRRIKSPLLYQLSYGGEAGQ
jgi:hypothetical protein